MTERKRKKVVSKYIIVKSRTISFLRELFSIMDSNSRQLLISMDSFEMISGMVLYITKAFVSYIIKQQKRMGQNDISSFYLDKFLHGLLKCDVNMFKHNIQGDKYVLPMSILTHELTLRRAAFEEIVESQFIKSEINIRPRQFKSVINGISDIVLHYSEVILCRCVQSICLTGKCRMLSSHILKAQDGANQEMISLMGHHDDDIIINMNMLS